MKFNPSISFKDCVKNWEEIYNELGVDYPFTRMMEYKHYVNAILDKDGIIYGKIKDYIDIGREKEELQIASETQGFFDEEKHYQLNYKQKIIMQDLTEVPENYPHLMMMIKAKFHNYDEGNNIEYFYNNDGIAAEEVEAFRDDLFKAVDRVKIAVQLNIEQQVINCLSLGYDFNEKDEKGCNLLHFVKSKNIVNILVEHGADVNSCDKYGQSPIFKAVNKEVAEALISNGAVLSIKDKKGNDALQIAIYTKNSDLIRVLKANGMSKDNNDSKSPTSDKSKEKTLSM